MPTKNILLIEDDEDIAELVQLQFEQSPIRVEHTCDGIRGMSMALQQEWDMVMLDLNLPCGDGIAICKEIRRTKKVCPIVIITARTSEAERVLGFNSGADDYIMKPFSPVELMARIDALFRRIEAIQNSSSLNKTMRVGEIEINTRSRDVVVGGVSVSLTAKEYDLLLEFVKNPNKVFKRSDLLETVWGQSYEGYLHTVNTHINRLRFKIEPNPKHPRYITTVWGVGYKLVT